MSIQFTSPFIQSGPGIAAISDAHAAATAFSVDSAQQSVTITYRYGNATVAAGKTTAFAIDQAGPGANITVSITTGTWQAGGLSGTLTAPELAAITTVYNNILSSTAKNAVELFAVNHNIFGAGATNVPWQ